MFGRETFIVRIAEDALAPRMRAGDYVWVDPDEPAGDRRLVAMRDPARGSRGGETVVRLLVEHDGPGSCARSTGAAPSAPSTLPTPVGAAGLDSGTRARVLADG